MERECLNRHLNIVARVRAGEAKEFRAFQNIKSLDIFIIKCCGKSPELNLREVDLQGATNLTQWQIGLVLDAYVGKISIDKALQLLKTGGGDYGKN